jgi:hypothetical protein
MLTFYVHMCNPLHTNFGSCGVVPNWPIGGIGQYCPTAYADWPILGTLTNITAYLEFLGFFGVFVKLVIIALGVLAIF